MSKQKRYRLKKRYPSLPRSVKEGDIVWRPNNPSAKPHWGYTTDSLAMSGVDIPVNEVEDNPEYWEKVEEKKYEILELFGENNRNVHQVKEGKVCRFNGSPFDDDRTWGTNDPVKFVTEYSDDWSIHTIKRLSDGKVFSVGDRVESISTGKIYHIGEIRISEVFRGNVAIYPKGENYGFSILNIKPKEEPIFTTEDGVDIYEGDTYYYIGSAGDIISMEITSREHWLGSNKDNAYKRFSSERAARKYIESNSPIFTTEDGVDIYKGDSYWYVTQDLRLLKKEKALATSGCTHNKQFYYKHNAERYIEDQHTPEYSKADIKNAYEELYDKVQFGAPFGYTNFRTLMRQLNKNE